MITLSVIINSLFCVSTIILVNGYNTWEYLDLPDEHLSPFFYNNPNLSRRCSLDTKCAYKHHVNQSYCWSYEQGCDIKNPYSYAKPTCPEDHKGWVETKEEQLELFYTQADFGFIQEQREQLQFFCSPHKEAPQYSSLQCSDHLKFCRGQHIYLDLRALATRTTPVRYHMDVLTHGDVGGYCTLDHSLLALHSDQISPLQSWGPELRHFTGTTHPPHDWLCDVWYDKPVILTKIDAAVSLYHHFCDFFNLYMTQHVNSSDHHAFSTDVQVIIWESFPYRSSFADVWKVFTRHPIQTLADVAGKRLCFREVLFPLLPRMIFGLYYNTPVVWGCERSGLFHAFNRHVLHRLRVPYTVRDERVRVTLLSRRTQHRRVLNMAALATAVQDRHDLHLTLAEFDHGTPFQDQMRTVAATDVLVGIHGAGLTHLLFLPDWAAVFELYNCGDEHCYKDLARLRGVRYFTWEKENKMMAEDQGNHPSLGAHEKFTNYEFDVEEFMKLLDRAVTAVRRHPAWPGRARDKEEL